MEAALAQWEWIKSRNCFPRRRTFDRADYENLTSIPLRTGTIPKASVEECNSSVAWELATCEEAVVSNEVESLILQFRSRRDLYSTCFKKF